MVRIKFRNTAEIQKYYQEQILKGNQSAFKNIKSKDGKSSAIISDEVLITEADRLRRCIQKYIDEFYKQPYYTGRPQLREYRLQKALKVNADVKYDGNKKYIGLYFDDSKSWGESVVTGELTGYKPYLINFGWQVIKNVWFKNIYRFGYYEGFHFIEKGIEEWKSDLKYHIDIEFSDSSLEFLSRIS